MKHLALCTLLGISLAVAAHVSRPIVIPACPDCGPIPVCVPDEPCPEH